MGKKIADTSRISTIGLFRYAISYLQAGEALLSCTKDVLYPRLFLYAHAIELGLKAFIFEKTGKIGETHNLVNLQKEAETYGFVFSNTFKSILKTLTNLNNDDHRTRYFKNGATVFPNRKILQNETEQFFYTLAENIPDGDELTERFSKEKIGNDKLSAL